VGMPSPLPGDVLRADTEWEDRSECAEVQAARVAMGHTCRRGPIHGLKGSSLILRPQHGPRVHDSPWARPTRLEGRDEMVRS